MTARQFRQRASISPDKALGSIEDAAKAVLGIDCRSIHENHLTGRGVRLIAGMTADGGAVVVGPQGPFAENNRFGYARAVFQLAVASEHGPRLVTDAFTWNQRASRAFAAELIAPQQALKARAGSWANRQLIRDLATEFQASTIVIERQLCNAKVPIVDE